MSAKSPASQPQGKSPSRRGTSTSTSWCTVVHRLLVRALTLLLWEQGLARRRKERRKVFSIYHRLGATHDGNDAQSGHQNDNDKTQTNPHGIRHSVRLAKASKYETQHHTLSICSFLNKYQCTPIPPRLPNAYILIVKHASWYDAQQKAETSAMILP